MEFQGGVAYKVLLIKKACTKSEKYHIKNEKTKSLKDTMKAYFCYRHRLF